MRNCFVPNCDAYCKQNNLPKRMMFTAPKVFFARIKRIISYSLLLDLFTYFCIDSGKFR